MYGCGNACLILIPFRLPQISCFTLSLKCFSSDSDCGPSVGIRPLLQFPHPPRAGPVLLTLLFFPLVPLSYWVFHGSIYSFPLVKYSCLFLTGVLHALLCLKAYSWCICGERCAPYPPTPLPSCFPVCRLFNDGIVTGMRWYLVLWQLVMLSIFWYAFWPSVCLLWRSVFFRSSAHFLIGLFGVFCLFVCLFLHRASWALCVF